MAKRPYIALDHDYLWECQDLTDGEFGRFCRALLHFGITGEEIITEGNERYFLRRAYARERQHQKRYRDLARSGVVPQRAKPKAPRSTDTNTKTNINNNTNTKINNNTNTDIHSKCLAMDDNNTNTDIPYNGMAKDGVVTDEAFLQFWKDYPSDADQEEDAWISWMEHVGLNEGPLVLEALEVYRECWDWNPEARSHIPPASQFLRERIWEQPPHLHISPGSV